MRFLEQDNMASGEYHSDWPRESMAVALGSSRECWAETELRLCEPVVSPDDLWFSGVWRDHLLLQKRTSYSASKAQNSTKSNMCRSIYEKILFIRVYDRKVKSNVFYNDYCPQKWCNPSGIFVWIIWLLIWFPNFILIEQYYLRRINLQLYRFFKVLYSLYNWFKQNPPNSQNTVVFFPIICNLTCLNCENQRPAEK